MTRTAATQGAASGGAGRRRAFAAVLTILFLVLPPLVGGSRIDDPVGAAEIARLQSVQTTAASPRSLPAELYYGATSGEIDAGAVADSVGRARLANVFALFALSGLLYLLLSSVRGRATAVLGCAALACLPPVAVEGAILRPEVPGSVFALLGILLLVGFPAAIPRVRGGRAVLRWLNLAVLACVVGVTFGLAAACVSSIGIHLLVPGGALLLVAGLHVWRTVKLLRRRGPLRFPVRGLTHRLFPWVLLVVLAMGSVWGTLGVAVEGPPIDLQATSSSVGLLPHSALARVPLLALAILGAGRLLLTVGLRLGRVRRIEPGTLLGVFVAVLLMQRALITGTADALPAAAAFAALIAEGAVVVLIVAIGFAMRRR